ncbi:unnamed protein product [Coffea canephora]|uniref:Uncharacterized protein n=1 Tax=Coffea canephora TaxID=49390 RepID=A0A068TLV9_COFCA|nr:unnamed protein product [Coffea canephora]
MGIRLIAAMVHAKQVFRSRAGVHGGHASPTAVSSNADVPKGHLAVYVGESYKYRFVVPLSYLKHPLFLDLLRRAEEENGFDHPMGGLTIPCSRNAFLDMASRLNDC